MSPQSYEIVAAVPKVVEPPALVLVALAPLEDAMQLSLRVIYDADGNYKVTDRESDESFGNDEINTDCEVATVLLEINLPEITSRTVSAKIPQSDESDTVARVTVE